MDVARASRCYLLDHAAGVHSSLHQGTIRPSPTALALPHCLSGPSPATQCSHGEVQARHIAKLKTYASMRLPPHGCTSNARFYRNKYKLPPSCTSTVAAPHVGWKLGTTPVTVLTKGCLLLTHSLRLPLRNAKSYTI